MVAARCRPGRRGADGRDGDATVSRVLVVDDEPQMLRALRINLHARGYEVVDRRHRPHGAAEAAAARPDLVVLDLGLPDMDGVEVIQGLRGWTSVPIIVLSGRTSGGATRSTRSTPAPTTT